MQSLTVHESGFDGLVAEVGVGKWKRSASIVYFFAAKSLRTIESFPSEFVSYSSGINHRQEAFPTPTLCPPRGLSIAPAAARLVS